MNSHAHYAFYGSLRRGMSNYNAYKEGLLYLYSVRLKGYQLFSLGDYPCAVKSDNTTDSIVAEVFQVTSPEVERAIHQLEIEAGYYFTNICVGQQEVGIYLYESAPNYQEVFSGDWVQFFRKYCE